MYSALPVFSPFLHPSARVDPWSMRIKNQKVLRKYGKKVVRGQGGGWFSQLAFVPNSALLSHVILVLEAKRLASSSWFQLNLASGFWFRSIFAKLFVDFAPLSVIRLLRLDASALWLMTSEYDTWLTTASSNFAFHIQLPYTARAQNCVCRRINMRHEQQAFDSLWSQVVSSSSISHCPSTSIVWKSGPACRDVWLLQE